MAGLALAVTITSVVVGASCFWMGYVLGSWQPPEDGQEA